MLQKTDSSAVLKTLESKGILFAMRFDAAGGIAVSESIHQWEWRILALADARARREIEQDRLLPEDVRTSLLSTDGHYDLAYRNGWLHGCLPDFLHEHYGDSAKLGHLRIALNDTRLLTARKQPLQTLDDVRLLAEQEKVPLPVPFDFLRRMTGGFHDNIARRVTQILEQLDVIEDRIVGDSWHGERERLSAVRRQTVTLNRHCGTVSGVFRSFLHSYHDQIPPDMKEHMQDFIERGSALHHDIEQIQARARLLQDEIMARLSERSNSLLAMISIMTAVMLPATIVTGMFGMNTLGMPFGESPYGFWFATGVAIAFAGLFYFLVRRLFGKL